MQLSLRPYVTAGMAIAGASVIAVAPIQPTLPDVQIPNPIAQVSRDVQLTGFIDDTVNQVLFSLIASPTVQISEALLVPLAEALGVDEATAAALPLASLGIVGPIISGGGATGLALQRIVDSLGADDPVQALAFALLNLPATPIDGIVNGGYGPTWHRLSSRSCRPIRSPSAQLTSSGVYNRSHRVHYTGPYCYSVVHGRHLRSGSPDAGGLHAGCDQTALSYVPWRRAHCCSRRG